MNSLYVSDFSDRLIEAADVGIYDLKELWESGRGLISVSVNRGNITLIDTAIDSAISFYESGNTDEYLNALSLARRQIRQLKTLEKFSAGAVI